MYIASGMIKWCQSWQSNWPQPFWSKIHVNRCVLTSLPFVSQDDLLSLKPDVVLLKGSNCVIAEVSCPYDLYANEVCDEKRRKYAALSEEIERNGFRCSV